MKKYILIILLVLVVGIGIFIYKGTYSIEEDVSVKKDLILKYDDNVEDKFYNYIDMIDDVLIPTSSYVMSDVLSDNYDFLTVFAIKYILENEDLFKQDIEIMDKYTYNNGYMDYSTNKYVNKDIIYMITDEVFGKRDYVIINDYLEVNNDMVPLLILDEYDFEMAIQGTEVNRFSDNYIVNVRYKDNDLIYRYIFVKDNDRLILKNVEI